MGYLRKIPVDGHVKFLERQRGIFLSRDCVFFANVPPQHGTHPLSQYNERGVPQQRRSEVKRR